MFDAIKLSGLTKLNLVKFLNPIYFIIDHMPLAKQGFAWVVPALILALISGGLGGIIQQQTKKREERAKCLY